jgi:hypothetical protein
MQRDFSARFVDICTSSPYSAPLMMSTARYFIFRVLFVAGIASLLASCSSTPPSWLPWSGSKKPQKPGEITLIKPYLLDFKQPKRYSGEDQAIRFERDHYMFGAISAKDNDQRQGHYYTVMWRVTDIGGPVKLRMEYRQEKTGFEIRTQEQEFTSYKHHNVAEFKVTGNAFKFGGRITCFRFRLYRDNQLLDQKRSYLWEKEDATPSKPVAKPNAEPESPNTPPPLPNDVPKAETPKQP